MNVSEIGEFGLIDLISTLVQKDNIEVVGGNDIITGIGDDAAAWKSKGKIQLSTTDSMIQDVHFSLDYISCRDLGYKSIAINLSDIAAMGGIPQFALVSISLPGHFNVDNIMSLYNGMIEISNKYKVRIVGGNISSAQHLMINVTINGYSPSEKILQRSAAKPGDKIFISGNTGLSSAGMFMLRNKGRVDKEKRLLLEQAHFRPEPRVDEGQIMLKNGVKAAIDISDGLLNDLKHVCDSSNVSAIIRSDLIPLHPILKTYFPNESLKLALSGGEDYELLFTAKPEIVNKIRPQIRIPITEIGDVIKAITSDVIRIVDHNNNELKFPDTGWEHFKIKS